MAYAADQTAVADTPAPETSQESRKARELVDRYNRLLDQRRLHDILAQDLAQYIIPRKAQITYRLAPGAKQTTLLYTTAAIKANEFLASSMSGMLTPSTIQWFSLQMEEEDLNQVQEVQEWLDTCKLRMLAALNRSNFKAESNEMYLDLGCFGTGMMFSEEIGGPKPFNGVRFRTMPYGTYVIAEGPDGRVDTVGRKLEMSVRAAAKQFGAQALTSASQQKLKEMQDDPIGIIHMVYPREGGTYDRSVGPKNRKWASCYIEVGNTASYGGDPGVAGSSHLLQEGGFYEFPYLSPRWSKSSHETYGRGPGHTALPDIKTLNKTRELFLRAGGKWVDPPIGAVDDGVIGKVRTNPSGITTVRSKDSLFTLFDGHKASFPLTMELMQELTTAINGVFYSDILRLPQKQYMTATEVQAMLEEMQRALGPVVGRLESEFLAPLIDRLFSIMYRSGMLPPPPDMVNQAIQAGASSKISVVYVGPLARSQKFTDVTAVQRFMALMQPIIQVSPTAADNVDSDEFTRYIGSAVDLPPRLFRPKQEVDDIRAQQHAQMQDQMKEQKALNAAKAAKDMGGAIGDIAGAVQGGQPAPPPQGAQQ